MAQQHAFETRLRHAVAVFRETYGAPPPRHMPVLDHALFALAWEGGPAARAFAAYKQFVNAFCNRNEMRVSQPGELAAQLEEIPGAEDKAQRMLEVLRYVFDTTYAFDLESMRAKPAKQACKQLSKIAGMTPFAVAATALRALDEFALPLDGPALAMAEQLGLLPAGAAAEAAAEWSAVLTNEEAEILCVGLGELAADPRQAALLRKLAAPAAAKKPAAKPAKKTVPAAKPAPRKKPAPAKARR